MMLVLNLLRSMDRVRFITNARYVFISDTECGIMLTWRAVSERDVHLELGEAGMEDATKNTLHQV